MAITRLGLCGSAAAYLGFSPKNAAPTAQAQYTIVVTATPRVIIVSR